MTDSALSSFRSLIKSEHRWQSRCVGSSDYTATDLEHLFASGAKLKEMEGAAIAWACFLNRCPFFAIKSVTNLIDVNQDSPAEFVKNFEVAVASLTEAVVRVVTHLSGPGFARWIADAKRRGALRLAE